MKTPLPRGIRLLLDELWDVSNHAHAVPLVVLLDALGYDVEDDMKLCRDLFAPLPEPAAALREVLYGHPVDATARDLAEFTLGSRFSRGRMRRSLRHVLLRAHEQHFS